MHTAQFAADFAHSQWLECAHALSVACWRTVLCSVGGVLCLFGPLTPGRRFFFVFLFELHRELGSAQDGRKAGRDDDAGEVLRLCYEEVRVLISSHTACVGERLHSVGAEFGSGEGLYVVQGGARVMDAGSAEIILPGPSLRALKS